MISYFDAYCALGPLTAPTFGQEFTTTDELLAAMEHAGIAEALVYSPAAYEYDPVAGNAALMKAVAGHDNLHPCWVLLPPATREMLPPDRLLAEMQTQGVHAARLCPGPLRNNFSLDEWCSGALLALLAAASVPLFLDLDEVTWEDIASLLARHSHLPIVLTGVTYRIDRLLYPLWEQYENLYVELSGYQGYLAIEAMVKRFGPQRLLFGSHMPRFASGASIAAAAYADISDDAKALIAGDNLRRLLGGVYAD